MDNDKTITATFTLNEAIDGVVVGATWVAGHSDSALSFNGASYVNLGSSNTLGLSGDLTISFWVKTTSASTQYIYSGHSTGPSYLGWGVRMVNGRVGFYGDIGGWKYETSSVNDGNWHFVSIVKSGTTVTFYKDGAADGTATGISITSPVTSINRYIGKSLENVQYFNGALDEFQIFTGALTLQQVSSLYTSGSDEVRSGLIGEWLFNEGTGTTAYDTHSDSDFVNDGVVVGATWVAGHSDSALSFNGASYVNLGSSNTLGLSGDLTISFWVKTTSASTQYIYSGHSTGPSYLGWGVRMVNGRVGFYGDIGGWKYETSSVNDGNWHFVSIVKSGTTVTFYKDGAADGTATGISITSPVTSINRYIGKSLENVQYFNGALDEFQIFTGALTLQQVSSLYTSGSDEVRSGLIGEWLFNEGTGTTAYDTHSDSDFVNDGVVVGATWVAGHSDSALSFNGASYVNLGSSNTLGLSGDLTISFWVKTTSASTQYIYSGHSTGPSYLGWGVRMVNGRVGFYGDIGGWKYETSSVNDGNWHFVSIVKSGTTVTFYKDGAADGTATGISITSPVTSINRYIGKSLENVQYFNGALDEFQIFTGALTLQQVSSLYTSGSDEVRSGLIGEWLFNEGTGTTAYDTHNN